MIDVRLYEHVCAFYEMAENIEIYLKITLRNYK